MSDQKNLGHNSKKDFLKNPVEHIDITSFDARKIISSMEKMSFVSRETANAANIYNEMLKDKECTIFLTLAGSTSAAGCMNIYKDFPICFRPSFNAVFSLFSMNCISSFYIKIFQIIQIITSIRKS